MPILALRGMGSRIVALPQVEVSCSTYVQILDLLRRERSSIPRFPSIATTLIISDR